MSDGIEISAQARMGAPRDASDMRARALALLRARLEEIWAEMRAAKANTAPPRASDIEQ